MAGISKFLSPGARKDKVERFEELSKGKTKEETRELEMALLKPEPVPDYIGRAERYVANSELAVKIVFSSQEEMDLVERHISIPSYKGRCISDLKLFLALFRALDDGQIVWDKRNQKLLFPQSQTEEEPSPQPVKIEATPEVPSNPVVRRLLRRS